MSGADKNAPHRIPSIDGGRAPASDPYQLGDDVPVYVSEIDPDSEIHGKEGTITDILQDTLGDETGREMGFYSYRIETDS